MTSKTLFGNALSMGMVQLVNLGLPLLWLPYLARVLGADQLGRVAFALAAAQLLVIVTDYGFNLSATKAIALHRSDRARVTQIWLAVTCARTLLAAAGLVAIVLSAAILPRARAELDLLLCAYIMVIGNVLYPQWLFQGLERLKLISLIQVVARAIIFALIVVLVKTPDDGRWATVLQGAGTLFGGLLALPLVWRELDRERIVWPGMTMLRQQFVEGWHVFLSTAAVSIYTSCNAFFLGMIVSPAALAYYHVAEKLIRAVQSMYGAVSNAIYPHVSRLALEGPAQLMEFNRKLLIIFLSGSALVATLVFVAAPVAVRLSFGDKFAPAAAILQLMSPLIVIVVLSNIFGVQTMLPLGMEKTFSKILLSAALLNFVFFIPLAIRYGIAGAATANLLVEFFVTSAMALVLHRQGMNPAFRQRTPGN